jgi:hypothetical protein
MADYSSTPPLKSPSPVPRSPGQPRLTTSKLFLPLVADTASSISTRGQVLPSLFARRPSTIRRGSLTDDDEDIEALRAGLMMPYDRDPEMRRNSNAASILNTPQMRSQRLIGNSNPRYKWEKYFKSEEELKGLKISV